MIESPRKRDLQEPRQILDASQIAAKRGRSGYELHLGFASRIDAFDLADKLLDAVEHSRSDEKGAHRRRIFHLDLLQVMPRATGRIGDKNAVLLSRFRGCCLCLGEDVVSRRVAPVRVLGGWESAPDAVGILHRSL